MTNYSVMKQSQTVNGDVIFSVSKTISKMLKSNFFFIEPYAISTVNINHNFKMCYLGTELTMTCLFSVSGLSPHNGRHMLLQNVLKKVPCPL